MERCKKCGSSKLYSFSIRSDYGSFDALNQGGELENAERPYTVDSTICVSCESVGDDIAVEKEEEIEDYGRC